VAIETNFVDQTRLQFPGVGGSCFEHGIKKNLGGHPACPGTLVHVFAESPSKPLVELLRTKPLERAVPCNRKHSLCSIGAAHVASRVTSWQ
jgi:hypothetical protein